MSTVVRFSPELGEWLLQNLNLGQAPAELVRIMIEERMDPLVARVIVDAFVSARQNQRALPVGAVELPDPAPDYAYETPIFGQRARFVLGTRTVPVLLRAHQPILAVLGNVLDAEECQRLIELARPRLEPSTIVSPSTGQNVVAPERTSLGMFFRLRENPFIARLDARVSELMNLPIENGEGFQILCYPAGTESAAHFDFLQPSNESNRASIARSGQRVSTLIAYLNDVELGGETMFPKLPLSVLPQRGNAVYFEYCNSQNQLDHASLHAGSRVRSGEKWIATKWMRQRRFVSASEAGAEGMSSNNG